MALRPFFLRRAAAFLGVAATLATLGIPGCLGRSDLDDPDFAGGVDGSAANAGASGTSGSGSGGSAGSSFGGSSGFGGSGAFGGSAGSGGSGAFGGSSASGGTGGSAGSGGSGASGGSSGAGGSGGSGGGPDLCNPKSCAGCCDALENCRTGAEIQACGVGGVVCIDCAGIGLDCSNGACQGQPPKCDVSTCPVGCCDAQGVCRTGAQSDACGRAGRACVDCTLTGKGCSAGACKGTPPACSSANCGGCCDATGACKVGTSDTLCGTGGAQCADCASAARVCTQPGNYCAFFPTCGPFTCPSGCCDAKGSCTDGRADDGCGTSGQSCIDCTVSGRACAAQGFCYTGPHCGPDNCAGCCTATGQCLNGSSSSACGEFGSLCENCSTSGKACVGQACSSGGTCPAGYSACNPSLSSPPPVASASCSASQLLDLAQVCQGPDPGQVCGDWFGKLLGQDPGCYDCLIQFTTDQGYARCLAPFLTAECNHVLSCALDCSNTVCGQCPASQSQSCQDGAFSQSSPAGPCVDFYSGYYCAEAAKSGPGAFCSVENANNDVGQWLQNIGRYYCAE